MTELNPGDTYEPGSGPHGGHTITVVERKPNPPDPDVVTVSCGCGSKWQFEATEDDHEDHEDHDEEACEDPDCAEAEEWVVDVEVHVSFTVRAHSEDKAQEWAEDFGAEAITVREPSYPVEDWQEDGTDITVVSRELRDAERRRIRAEMERTMAAEGG